MSITTSLKIDLVYAKIAKIHFPNNIYYDTLRNALPIHNELMLTAKSTTDENLRRLLMKSADIIWDFVSDEGTLIGGDLDRKLNEIYDYVACALSEHNVVIVNAKHYDIEVNYISEQTLFDVNKQIHDKYGVILVKA